MNKRIFVIFAMIFSFVPFSHALETDTHEEINEYIAMNTLNGFSLDSYIKDRLDFKGGIEEDFSSHQVWRWLGMGGLKEDIPFPYLPYLRSVNHFHNPLTNEGFSGIWGTGVLSGTSSIQWAQSPIGTQSPGGHYSWFDVRNFFYMALTVTDKTIKEASFADTFRGLGQLMHLVQDLSVPEHTRDDGHYIRAYEAWVASHVDIFSIEPELVDSLGIDSLKNGSSNQQAPVPIANLFDSDQYTEFNPDLSVTLQPNIGLSEYTNANFLSPDTIFTSDFPYPRVEDNILYRNEINGRQYLRSEGQGEHVNHLAVVSWLYFWRMRHFPQHKLYLPLGLDPVCYQDYAEHLIPKAVGYSAALLDYFFRGAIEITNPVIGFNDSIGESDTVTLFAENTSPEGEEMSGGFVTLVVKYRLFGDEQFQYITQELSDDEQVIPRDQPIFLEFHLDSTPIPKDATDIAFYLVYKGQLGLEQDAVAVGFEPIHKLEISPPERFAYSIIDGSITPHQFTYIKAKVKNPNTEHSIGSGVLQAKAIYKNRIDYQDDLSADPPTAASREPDFSESISGLIDITSLSSEIPQEYEFDFSSAPIPAGITDLSLQIFFRGSIDEQTDSLASGSVDLYEPAHIGVSNSTDRFYLDHVLRTSDEITASGSLRSRVDLNSNGVLNEEDEPYIEPLDVSVGLAIYPTGGTPPDPDDYSAIYFDMQPGMQGKIIMLSDMPEYNLLFHYEYILPYAIFDERYTVTLSGVINQENTQGLFQRTQVYSLRGYLEHYATLYAHAYPDNNGIFSAPWPDFQYGPVPLDILRP